MKNIGVSILSRYNSKRLEGKALIEINGKKLLSHIVDKINYDIPDIETYITTSKNSSDDIIIEYCKRNNYKHFRGSLDNVASRLLNCGIENNWDYIIRINGDNLFIDTSSLKSMISIAQTKEFDFISNVPGRTFPYGMSIEIVKTEFYKSVYKNLKTDHDKEHVTSWIYRNKSFGNSFFFKNKKYKNLKEFKLSIDDLGDLNFIKKIVSLNNNKNNISLSKLSLMRDKLIRGK